MANSTPPARVPSARVARHRPTLLHSFTRATQPLRALARATIFFLKVFPMLPSRPIDWVTRPPLVEKVIYPTRFGHAEGDLYRPSTGGPHPGIVVCLGVVPFGVEHPQVAVLGKALARAGFAALLYWSPAMRDFRLDPEDVENIPLAYRWLIDQPYVDPDRSGLLGTCVGGSFSLMAAASPLIRHRVAFIGAYAPFSSMRTFTHDIASATCSSAHGREPWQVDPLTRKVFLHSLTALLEPGEAGRLRSAFTAGDGHLDDAGLSADGQAVYSLLTAPDADHAQRALHRLPPGIQERLDLLSPMNYLKEIHAPLIVLLHDQGDQVIPVGESRRLCSALATHVGVRYTEMHFQHLDPLKGKLPLFRLVGELGKFFRAVYPMFRQAAFCQPAKRRPALPQAVPSS
jgi:dipeptidyl aminopeptidase/acylaminoacyl peptidase